MSIEDVNIMHPVAILFLLSCFIGLYLNLYIIPPETDDLTALAINAIVGSLIGIFTLIFLPI